MVSLKSNAQVFCWAFVLLWLTYWGRVMHLCVGNLIIISSDDGLLPGRCLAIIWTNAGILLIDLQGTNFSEIVIKILTFSFKKMHLKILSAKWQPLCLSLSVLRHSGLYKMAAISQTTYLNTFSWMTSYFILIKISLEFVHEGSIDGKSALIHAMLWCRVNDKLIIWTNAD